ncbi:phosphoribosyltransferase family protein [Paenibacillus sp. GCM10023248]|uniref:phosphoribosyltransferase family protein n=1 Tax=unclassified Paenibacillus TaxID=185978 RepID=UPI002379A24C|nr:phosphoribosyltransferase family protein [Paenibacillus sp. MAHUQ-63]MDD9271226.1 phosphoribosyltransferase family protein [Paenibacillus sp. MAHUQ-63]
MNNNNTVDYYPVTERTYKIAGDLELKVKVEANPFQIPLDSLFGMAARINKKRSFLFVSKVLGKHIPVRPYTSLLSGVSLGLLLQQAMQGSMPDHLLPLAIQGLIDPARADNAYQEIRSHRLELPQPAVFIGFAETATAIGHAAFHTFSANNTYIHTTREIIDDTQSILNFSEEHSHAVAHYCYAEDPHLFAQAEVVVLVDDEMTTGKTSLNIIRDMQAKFPKKTYYVLALLDWRTAADLERFRELEQELGIAVHVLTLVKGEVTVTGSSESLTPAQPELPLSQGSTSIDIMYVDHLFAHSPWGNQRPYLQYSGRFGLTPEHEAQLGAALSLTAKYLRETRIGTKTLCVGTGEFMYIPMRIAAEMGEGVSYQSTTRSPIHTIDRDGYAVKSGYPYASPEDPEVTHFMYNVPVGEYEDLYLFLEREADQAALQPLLRILETRGLQRLHLVFFSPQTVEWKEGAVWKIGGADR